MEVLDTINPDITKNCKVGYGLSLGEYVSLPFNGAVSFEDGARIMKARYVSTI